MEYVFGTVVINGVNYENLKTIGEDVLSGFSTIKREFTDCNITDSFRVVRQYESKESDGKIYRWYIIDRHSRTIDYFSPNKSEIETNIAEVQEGICETSTALEERIATIEDALCSLA